MTQALTQPQIDSIKRKQEICKLLSLDYSNLTNGLSDDEILNDIVTILLARKIFGTDKNSPYNALHWALDNIE